ncbi:MAG: DNA repair protein RecN [Clostridiales bacterium]|nr:DNA repair protein RecN [Clostridiales bacterium]
MVSRIHIQNIGIIEDIEIDFTEKLNIITGETGAGKTLIIDSINLVTGNRVNKDIIRNGQEKAFIEICFLYELEGISEDGMIILSREIYSNGKNICKINGKMATLTQLKNIGDILIDIHGQHDINNLLNPNMHMKLLDNYIGNELKEIKIQYKDLLNNQKEIAKKQKELCANPIERQRKLELLEYQINEIQEANLIIGEEEELSEKKTLYQNYEKIYSALSESYKILENQVMTNANSIIGNISKITSYNEKYNQIYEKLQDVYYNIEDIKSEIYDEISKNDFDENENERILERLDEIFKLKRKYGNTVEEILKYYEKISKEFEDMKNSDEIINELNKEYELNNQKLFNLAFEIHQIRIKCAKKVKNIINEELVSLEMPKAEFDIISNFNENNEQYEKGKKYSFSEDGLDDVKFMIRTNVGSKPQIINKIASGGELSRITLALKTVFAEIYNIPTIIFDEIDTGLSGEATIALGHKLEYIAHKHQVICITHQANIAALGENNIFVKKEVEENITKTKIKVLNENEKIEEISRILGGKNITDTVRRHAIELINK